MSRVKMVLMLFLLLAVSACSMTEPFVNRRREAGKSGAELYVGSSKPEAPVVCYNSWVSGFEKVQKMADDECVKHSTGTSALLEKDEGFSCRILTPRSAKFQCVR